MNTDDVIGAILYGYHRVYETANVSVKFEINHYIQIISIWNN